LNRPGPDSRLLRDDEPGENERRVLAECQELVDAGEAAWVENRPAGLPLDLLGAALLDEIEAYYEEEA